MKKQQITATLVTTPTNASPKRSANTQSRQIAQLANVWNAMSGSDKMTWGVLAAQTAQANTLAAPAKLDAYPLFIQHSIMIVNSGGIPQTTAPANPVPPTPLPLLTLNAQYGPNGLILNLITSSAYPDKLLIYAARPAFAGFNTYKKSSFHLVGSLPSLASGSTSLTAIYNSKYHMPSAGYEAVLELVGVNAHGFRTARLLVTAIAFAPAQTASGTDDLEMHKVA